MGYKRIFYSCLAVMLLSSCHTSRETVMAMSDKKLYTVTVFIKNSEPVFASCFFHIGQPFRIAEITDGLMEPISKVIYQSISKSEFDELCRSLKNHPGIVAIQKEEQ